MKKTLIVLLSFFVFVGASQAQEYKKLMKSANKALSKYVKDPKANKDQASMAVDYVTQALAMDDSAPALLNLKGDIYNAIADAEIKESIINSGYKLESPQAASLAYAAYKSAYASDDKKAKKAALKGLEMNIRHLDNTAITHYTSKDYPKSFEHFSMVLEAHEFLNANGGNSFMKEDSTVVDKIFSTAVTGYYGDQGDKVVPYLDKLYSMDSKEPLVYEALYNLKGEDKYLNEGRAKFPGDKGLMFAMINEKIKKNDMAGAQMELENAIKAEPDNVSVIVTAGSVAEKLGDADGAAKYYNMALEKDPKNFDATYSLGAMYYNKAAAMTEELNSYANDFSKAGMKKYDDLKAVMDDLFDQSLPFFHSADSINPKDFGTLTALKELYARKNQMDKSKEFKDRLDSLK